MFLPLFLCLCVCMSVCLLDYSKHYERILMKFLEGWGVAQGTMMMNNHLHFGDDPDYDLDPEFLDHDHDVDPGIFKKYSLFIILIPIDSQE